MYGLRCPLLVPETAHTATAGPGIRPERHSKALKWKSFDPKDYEWHQLNAGDAGYIADECLEAYIWTSTHNF
jgi:hypothetical protein